MKKGLLLSLILATIAFGGCQTSSDEFLSFETVTEGVGVSFDTKLSESEFFAKKLTIITEEENKGDNEKLTAGATLLINSTNNELIYADNVYDKLYPASLTKLLTALIVIKYGELSDMVSISYNASHITEPGAKLCGYQEGDLITLETLLNSLLIYSGNDAAIAIAEHIGGSEESFVNKMNEEAKLIGATHSNFVNSHGLHDNDQYTTAYDLYLVFHELMNYDTFRTIINTPSYTANYTDRDGNPRAKNFNSTNQYFTENSEPIEGLDIIGGKTGTTRKAGNCLILLSKDDLDKEFISIILKASNSNQLYSQMSYLLNMAKDE